MKNVVDPYAQIAETLEKQCKGKKLNMVPSREIAEYLMYLCTQDQSFITVLLQKDKTFSKCCNYVYDYACAKLNRHNGAIDGMELLHIAEEYYMLTDEELAVQKKQWPNQAVRSNAKVAKAEKPEQSAAPPPPKAPDEPTQLSFFKE